MSVDFFISPSTGRLSGQYSLPRVDTQQVWEARTKSSKIFPIAVQDSTFDTYKGIKTANRSPMFAQRSSSRLRRCGGEPRCLVYVHTRYPANLIVPASISISACYNVSLIRKLMPGMIPENSPRRPLEGIIEDD